MPQTYNDVVMHLLITHSGPVAPAQPTLHHDDSRVELFACLQHTTTQITMPVTAPVFDKSEPKVEK